jgi:hypothetical protein
MKVTVRLEMITTRVAPKLFANLGLLASIKNPGMNAIPLVRMQGEIFHLIVGRSVNSGVEIRDGWELILEGEVTLPLAAWFQSRYGLLAASADSEPILGVKVHVHAALHPTLSLTFRLPNDIAGKPPEKDALRTWRLHCTQDPILCLRSSFARFPARLSSWIGRTR